MTVDYKNDPYSEGDACNQVCCRGDLYSKNPKPDGCYDTKVSMIWSVYYGTMKKRGR